MTPDDPSAPAVDDDPDAGPPAGQKQEKVEDRPTVGTVKPEDYPEDQRAKGA